jgi:hypothetical protein
MDNLKEAVLDDDSKRILAMLDPSITKRCIICNKKIKSDALHDIYALYYDDQPMLLFHCPSKRCQSEIQKFVYWETEKLESKYLDISKSKMQCVECQETITSKPKCVRSGFDGVPSSMFSILCSENCARKTIKTVKAVGKDLKEHNVIKEVQLRCSGCAKFGIKYMKCGQCKLYYYCSKDCQRTHWKAGHKEQCNEFVAKK